MISLSDLCKQRNWLLEYGLICLPVETESLTRECAIHEHVPCSVTQEWSPPLFQQPIHKDYPTPSD